MLKEAGRGMKVPPDGRTLGATDLGTVRGRLGGATVWGKAGTGPREELLWAACQGREAQMSGGVWRAGVPSRWTVATRPGKKGGRRGGKEREKRSQQVKNGEGDMR